MIHLVPELELNGWLAALSRRETRRFSRLVKAAWIRAASDWQKNILPKHFTAAAGQLYGYKRRDPGYVSRKRRSGHGSAPLVFTGRTKRWATRRATKISATPKRGATVTLSLPFYVNRREATKKRRVGGAQMRRELTIRNPADMRRFVDVASGQIVLGFNQIRATRRVKFKARK